jgi:hypothetical protein
MKLCCQLSFHLPASLLLSADLASEIVLEGEGTPGLARTNILSSHQQQDFVTMVEVTVVYIAYRNERRKLTAKIRRTARWLVPIAFVVTN